MKTEPASLQSPQAALTDVTATAVAPPTEARVSLRALFVLTAVAALCAAVLGPFLRPLPIEKRITLLVFAALAALFFLGLVVFLGWLRRRAERQAGAVLIQLSPHSYFLPRAPRVMALIAGGFLLSFGFTICGSIIWGIVNIDRAGRPGGGFSFLLAALPQFFMSFIQFGWLIGLGIGLIWWTGAIRFCENGIVRRNEFIAWSDMHRHYWDACYRDVLVVHWGLPFIQGPATIVLSPAELRRHMRNFPKSGHLAVRVPATSRDAVAELMQRKVRPITRSAENAQDQEA